ncbi:hypothetical protein GCM10009677_43220 [Sphaerisporangium rubeum]|uniref:CBM2 domain-containing protein n=1 Tax=Sphaerisporangium rubeum TaxID=321317 RepID=A0A7X0M7P8_9ACTN|nr:hypothetical protein [Sphaerisporangium rubeum]MBB6474785.1 hypothetical protein [Sphaerisporangium rubeum]
MSRLLPVFLRVLCVIGLLTAGVAAGTAAEAAVPNRWGFALVDVTSGVPDPSHQAGSWPAGFNVTVTSGGVGQYFVKFPQIGVPNGGVVHVTALSQTAVWCQAQKWGMSGADEVVAVQCYRFGGTPENTRFSIVFEESSGWGAIVQGLGYVHWTGSGIGTQFNSTGTVNSVTPTGVGVWTVKMPNLGPSVMAGGIQVTAVNSSMPARCKVGAWAPTTSGQLIQVRCHNATNVPVDTGWTITYQYTRAVTGGAAPPRYFGYVFDNSPANPGPYTPVPAGVTFNSVGSFNEIQSAGPGQRMVTFHKIGVLQDNVQVTAYGPGPEFCNLVTVWGTWGMEVTVRNVICYSGTTRVDQPSMVAYTSAS